MEQPKPFAPTAAVAERELRPMLEAHAERLGGSLLEFWAADLCVHRCRSSDHKHQWLEAWFGAEYKLPELNDYDNHAFDSDLVDLRLCRVLPLDAHAIRIKFEISVVVSDE